MTINRLSDFTLSTPNKGDSFKNNSVRGPFYNVASGGTETTVTNYNGTGQTWKVHTFTGNGTLTVTSSTQNFRVLVIGGGGGSGGASGGYTGGIGGGGGVYESLGRTIPNGTSAITVGAGGYSTGFSTWVAAGNSSITIAGTTITAGGGAGGGSGPDGGGSAPGGTGTNGGSNGYSGGSGSGPGRNCNGGWQAQGANLTSNISGTSLTYSVVGGYANANRGGSAGCGSGNQGASGVVVVSYRIA